MIAMTEAMLAFEEAGASKEEIGDVFREVRRTNRQQGLRFRQKYQLLDVLCRLMHVAVTLKARKRRGEPVAAVDAYFEQLQATTTQWHHNRSTNSQLIGKLRVISTELEQLVKVGSAEGR